LAQEHTSRTSSLRHVAATFDTMDYKTSAPMTSSGLALSVSLAFAVVRIRSLLLLLVLLESLLLPLLLG